MSDETSIPGDEEWIADYPPFWMDWLLNSGAARSREEARSLLEMMRAVEDGDADEVRRRLKAGTDPNARTIDGWGSLLQTALERSSNPEVAQVLIDAGADTSRPALLYYAVCKHGFDDVAEKLLAAGKDPNVATDGQRLLTCVAMEGRAPMVKRLLSYGADINGGSTVYPTNSRKVTRFTPLMAAAWLGHTAVVKTLLESGADPNRRDSTGRTALDWARTRKSKQAQRIAEMLEQAGAVAGSGADLGIVDVPDFSKRAKAEPFQQALQELKGLTGAKPSRIELEEGSVKGGSAFRVGGKDRARAIVSEHQAALQERGCYLFWSRDVTNRGGECVIALPTTDAYEAIAAIQTEGANSQVSTGDLIRWLKELEKDQPFRLSGIGIDFVEGEFTTELKDPQGLAERIVKLCPDGPSGAREVAEYADHLARTRRLFLWWD